MNTTCAAAIGAMALAGALVGRAGGQAAPTFQDLMRPESFPTAQCGMRVEHTSVRAGVFAVRTTGAVFEIRPREGVVRCSQRIGHARAVAVVRFGRPLAGGAITHSAPGFARITFRSPAMAVRINGDSLMMLQPDRPLRVAIESRVLPGWVASDRTNHVIADEWGGFNLVCSERTLDDRFDPDALQTAAYPLPAGAVLWVGVCPPRPYPWNRSLTQNVVWHWSDVLGYPTDADLRLWKQHGSVVLLQSEVMLWKDWNLDFVPRLGDAEFARVRDTLHREGMRFMVYTSPAYFLRGTPLQNQAMNSFVNFKGWPPSTATGENMGIFLDAIQRMLRRNHPDGLYFDGQYTGNAAALYALARSARAAVGEDGLLEWHSTLALGDGDCSLPQADAYTDFVLRGEGQQARYTDNRYLRYFISGYNLSNTVGVLCNNAGGPPDLRLMNAVLAANARFHTIASWLPSSRAMVSLRNNYRDVLTPALRIRTEHMSNLRQRELPAQIAADRANRRVLRAAPDWDPRPVTDLQFDMMPGMKRYVSPANGNPFAVTGGALHIQAHASTYAYMSVPFNDNVVDGFEVKLRHGTDGGMSWGPAVALRWGSACLRIGTRADGLLQADIAGMQLVGHPFDRGAWIWLRARWQGDRGVIERSADGRRYETLWTFHRAAAMPDRPIELLVGKVPFNAQPADYTDAGALGDCEIAWVRAYRRAARGKAH